MMTSPEIRTLTATETDEMLGAHEVGRIAYSFRDRVDIEPISYAYAKGWIFVRTSMGTKLSQLAHHPWCAFEVDEVRGQFDWTSVVVHGSLTLLDPEVNADTYALALELLRDLVPETFTSSDPTPQRSILIGIHVDEVTGRTAVPRAA